MKLSRQGERRYRSQRRALLEHLRKETGAGRRYFKTKYLAEAIGIRSCELGHHIRQLHENNDEFDVSLWGKKTHVWYIAPKEGARA